MLLVIRQNFWANRGPLSLLSCMLASLGHSVARKSLRPEHPNGRDMVLHKVDIRCVNINFSANWPMFSRFFSRTWEDCAVDNPVFRLSISSSVSEIFAIQLSGCSISCRIVTPQIFKGAGPQNVYANYHTCLAAHLVGYYTSMEYRPVLLWLRRGAFTCVGWQTPPARKPPLVSHTLCNYVEFV